MSKPNLLGFATSVGFYRNKRVLDLREEIGKSVRHKIDFAELAPLLFQATMAYAAENQIDGNFSGYTTKDWVRIFAVNNVTVTTGQAGAIVRAFHQTGLFDGDKIRSWMKFNRHLADYEGIVRAKRKAAKLMHQKREQEARAALNGGEISAPQSAQSREKTAPKTVSKTGELWSLQKQLEAIHDQLRSATDADERKELKQRARELQSAITGVERKPGPTPSPAPLQKPARKLSPREAEKQALFIARQTLSDYPEGLTAHMVAVLLEHKVEVPAPILARFPKLNPVDG